MTLHPFVNMRRRLGKYDVNLKINVNVLETKTNILFKKKFCAKFIC